MNLRRLLSIAGPIGLAFGALPAYRALPGSFPDYICSPVLADTLGNAYAFNLTGIAGLTLATKSSEGGGNYLFGSSPCGIPTSACVPGQHPVGWPYAAVTQYFVGTASPGNCYNQATGAEQPCTDNCEPASVGFPQWQLIDASNATAGIWGSFSGIFMVNGDETICPWDPSTGTPTPRSSTVVLQCDSSMAPGNVTVTSIAEVRGVRLLAIQTQ